MRGLLVLTLELHLLGPAEISIGDVLVDHGTVPPAGHRENYYLKSNKNKQIDDRD